MEQIAGFMKALSESEVPVMTREEFLKQQIEWRNQTEGDLTGLDCRICRNKGLLYRLDEDGYERSRECECMKKRRCLDAIRRSGMEQLLERCTFDSYVASEDWQKHAKAQAQQYAAQDSGKWLYLAGQSGCGKTHLCTAVCNIFIQNGMTVKYVIWRQLLQELQALRFDADGYAAKMREIRETDVLYIDDFLKAIPEKSQSELGYAFEVINYRYVSGKQTIISSEMLLQEMEKLDAATAGRIAEKAADFIIQIQRNGSRNYRTQ